MRPLKASKQNARRRRLFFFFKKLHIYTYTSEVALTEYFPSVRFFLFFFSMVTEKSEGCRSFSQIAIHSPRHSVAKGRLQLALATLSLETSDSFFASLSAFSRTQPHQISVNHRCVAFTGRCSRTPLTSNKHGGEQNTREHSPTDHRHNTDWILSLLMHDLDGFTQMRNAAAVERQKFL